jgi:CHRD domain
MIRFIKLAPVILLPFIFSACKKDSTTPAPTIINFAASLNGASESSPNASTATGSSTGTFNTATKILALSTTYSGIDPTAGHVHKGEVGASGPVEFPFTITASPVLFTSAALTASEESDLMEGKYYVNLHSTAYPGGEIRGQLIKQ